MYKGRLKYLVIEITNKCNLNCLHCASDSGKARQEEISTQKIFQLLSEVKELGGEEVTILGGEPLLHKDWYSICQKVNDLNMKLILISNGLLIKDDSIIKKIHELNPYILCISIDGASQLSYKNQRGKDGFEHCINVLKNLSESGIKNVNAITTFTRSNLTEFDSFVELFENSEIGWQIQIAGNTGSRFTNKEFITLDDYKWLVEKVKSAIVEKKDTLKLITTDDFGYFPIDPKLRFLHQTWNGCPAGKELIGIRSNGDILGCLSLGDEFIESNIKTNSIKELWESDICFSNLRNKSKLIEGHCKRCTFNEQCNAGCTNIAYSSTGNIGLNHYCIRNIETEELSSIFNN